MKTGEGKTLTATLPIYLNALSGEGAMLITPNEYMRPNGRGLPMAWPHGCRGFPKN